MARPEIDIDVLRHMLDDIHITTENFNLGKAQTELGKIQSYLLMLIAMELDQIGDSLAVMANLKKPEDVTLT